MKILIILFLALLKTLAYGNKFTTGIEYGSIKLESKQWTRLSLQPQMNLGKLSFALDLACLFDENNKLRKEDWQTWQDFLSKIIYISYGKKDIPPVYLKLGGLEEVTLANGFIMNKYSNMTDYPTIKRIGADINLDLKKFGINAVVADIFGYKRTEEKEKYYGTATINGQLVNLYYRCKETYIDKIKVYAGRIFVRPIGRLELGVTYCTDQAEDIDIYGADLKLPIFGKLFLYADYAKIKDFGTGYILPGLGYRFNIGDFRLEYRSLEYNFIAGYFDKLYDKQNKTKKEDLSKRKEGKDYKGLKSELNLKLFNFVQANAGLEAITNNKTKTLYAKLTIPQSIPPISRLNISFFNKFKDKLNIKKNSAITISFGYLLSEKLETFVVYKITYDNQGRKLESRQLSTKILF